MANKATIRQAKYDSTHCTGYYLKLNNATDSDIIEKLSNLDSKQGYIKELIRKDIACTGSVPDSSVPVSMCDEAKNLLKDEAAKRGIDVCDLAKLIINQWVLQNSMDI